MKFNYKNRNTPNIYTNDINVNKFGGEVNNDKYNLMKIRMLEFNLMDESLTEKILSEDLEDIMFE